MDVDRSLLDLFWKLSEAKDAARVDASLKIVSHLSKEKVTFEVIKFLKLIEVNLPGKKILSKLCILDSADL